VKAYRITFMDAARRERSYVCQGEDMPHAMRLWKSWIAWKAYSVRCILAVHEIA
jgi:hypothetical protein